MGYMTQTDWDAYKAAIDTFHEDTFQQVITWRKLIVSASMHGEDSNVRHEDISIKGLVSDNHFRSWPINKESTAGEVDKESILVYFNNQYLSDLGYLNGSGQFKFKPVEDRFVINGLVYKASGESQSAQANNQPLLHFIILKREELNSQDNKY